MARRAIRNLIREVISGGKVITRREGFSWLGLRSNAVSAILVSLSNLYAFKFAV